MKSQSSLVDESVLLEKLKEHDPQAFQWLYEQYSPALYGVVFHIVRTEEQAQDLLQDIFVKIWKNIDIYDPNKSRLFTWMLDVARLEAINASKMQKKNEKTNRGARVWFESISLENVRSFGTKQTINFTSKDGNAARWNVILGDNGTGKTTVLKSIVYCFSRENVEAKYLFQLNRYNDVSSSFEYIEEVDHNNSLTSYKSSASIANPISAEISNDTIKYTGYKAGSDYDKIIFAYGAARKMSNGAIGRESNNYILSLFEENKSLINAEEWLIQTDYLRLRNKSYEKEYNAVYATIEKLFRDEAPAGIMFDTSLKVPQVKLCTHYGAVRLQELSLGYKTLIAWIVDFARGLFDRYSDSENPLAEPAVCLVDEIDLHLHPKFQQNIIKFLTETFPNTQFIVTAHSPLIVQSAEDANIILLKREGNETHVADGIDVHSWRVDQILSSDLFGGVSTRPPETEEKMNRRRALLLKNERTGAENEELEQLEEELGMLTASESKEAIRALELIGKALSK